MNSQDVADISVIIVNYNTAALAIAAVESVLSRDHTGHKVDVHLVDNASSDPERAEIEKAMARPNWAGRVNFYPEAINHGFGRGNNIVLRRLSERPSPPEKVFLLNPDARLENDALVILSDALDMSPQAAFAGAGISKPGEGPVVAAFRFPGLISEFEGNACFGPISRLFSAWRVPLLPDHPEGRVDWVAGAGVMARLDVLKSLGFFDPGFFLYYEEVDLMRRAQAAGWQCLYVPRARILHAEGASTGVKSDQPTQKRRPAYWYQSWALYFRKSHGQLMAVFILCAALLGTLICQVQSRLRGRSFICIPHALRDYALISGPLLLAGGGNGKAEGLADAHDGTVPGSRNCNPQGIGFLALVAEDFRTHEGDFFSQGFWALFWHRFGNWRMGVRSRVLRAPLTLLYRAMFKVVQWVCGIMLPYTVRVGRRVKLEHFGGMILVAEAIGDDVIIRQNTTFGISGLDRLHDRPVIGNRVEIGAGAVIVGRVHVGDDAIIGANAVVVRDVPAGAVVGGVPARLIRMRGPAG